MRWNERTREEIENIVKDFGYEFIDEYFAIHAGRKRRKVILSDNTGYKYDMSFENFIKSNKRKSSLSAFDTQNPFTLKNIKLWIQLENKSFMLLENNIYEGNDKKLYFKCFICKNIFDSSWEDVYCEKGCPYCVGKRVGDNNRLSIIRPDLAQEWDYNKNEFSPDEYTKSSRETVSWICSDCGNHWDARIDSRTTGNGCKKCSSSKGEKRINSFLNNHNIKYVIQKSFDGCFDVNKLFFDFYIPYYNLCIEYNGEQHYYPVDFAGRGKEWAENLFQKCIKRDEIKSIFCRNNNIKLLIIPFWEFNNIDNILKRELNI